MAVVTPWCRKAVTSKCACAARENGTALMSAFPRFVASMPGVGGAFMFLREPCFSQIDLEVERPKGQAVLVSN